MRILLLADLHRDSEILGKLHPEKYDLVIVAGDFEGEEYLEKLLSMSGNIYWIPGNMERPGICEEVPERCLHKKSLELVDGLKIVGFGFSNPTPFGTPGELSEEEIYEEMRKLPITPKTILVTHAPPYGILDKVSEEIHAGSKSIKRIMEEKRPLLLACGHIHDQEGKEKVGETTVVNIPQGSTHKGVLLEIKNGHVHLDVEAL